MLGKGKYYTDPYFSDAHQGEPIGTHKNVIFTLQRDHHPEGLLGPLRHRELPMNRMRTWSLGAAVLAFLILVAGWFLLISPTKAKVSDLQTQTASQKQTNVGLATQIAQLKVQNKNLPKQEAKLAKIRQHLPATPALPTFVRTLTTIAHEAGVKLVVVSPTPPVVVTAQAAAPVATPSASSADGAAPTEVAPAAPVAVPTGLKQIPVSITVSGGYYNIVQLPDQGRGPQAIDARLQHQRHAG